MRQFLNEDVVMPELILTDQQWADFRAASTPVVVRSRQGEVVGYLTAAQSPLGKEAELVLGALRARNNPGPRFTTDEVLDHLRSLESS